MPESTLTDSTYETSGQLDTDKNNVDVDELRAVARAGYADMLLDEERNRAYHKAIIKTVNKIAKSKDEPSASINITDIGTGTGLLAMMAIRSAKKLNIEASATAYECFGPMAKCAERVIEENSMSDNIKVLHMRGEAGRVSKECDKADLLITELFDTELIGEGALPIYRSALLHLVKSKGNASAVPAKARIWIQLISSNSLVKLNQFVPVTVGDAKTGTVTIHPPHEVLSCPGSGHLHDFQVNQLKPGIDFEFCSEPQVVFDYNFTDITSLNLMQSKEVKFTLTKTVCRSSILILFWWDLLMDSEGEIVLSLKPQFPKTGIDDLSVPWREHWIQAIYHLPAASNGNTSNGQILQMGSKVDVIASHDEFSLSFSLDDRIECQCNCGIHSHLSRTRLGVLNDPVYHQSYFDCIKKIMDKTFLTCSLEGTILYYGDSSLLPILMAKRWSNCKVYILSTECSSTRFHNLFAIENGVSSNCSTVSNVELIGTKVDLLVMEPYSLAADMPFDHLDLWVKFCQNPHMSQLDMDHVLPNRVIIEMAVVQFNHLWKTKSKVGQNVQGFNLQAFDSLIQEAIKIVDPEIESYFTWEYPCRALVSSPVTLFNWTWTEFQSLVYNEKSVNGTFNMNGSLIDPSLKHISFVFWTKFYHYDTLLHSTGPIDDLKLGSYINWPRNWKQGVSFEFLDDKFSDILMMKRKKEPCPKSNATTTTTTNNTGDGNGVVNSTVECENVTCGGTSIDSSLIQVEYSATYHTKARKLTFHTDLFTTNDAQT